MGRFWKSLLFETCERGISSAVAPELLPDNQLAWALNADIRGGKPSTRPNLRNRLTLPPGLIQGCEYFSIQGGMLVCSIGGRLYRITVSNSVFGVEEIILDFVNSSKIKQVWMTQTVGTLVIQDGQSNPILYNGSTAPRAVSGEVPRGRMMAYGNGRLWVAINSKQVVAGDITTSAAGSELNFTETTYLNGGGALYFSRDITGMAFIPVTGQADYGAMMVFLAGETHAIRADITKRDDWANIPGFVTNILRSVGAASQWSIVSVNQDLYWRDSNGGIRSIRNALADESGPGSSPVSREVSRLTDYDSQPQLSLCSGVYFDNRLLMTSSPYLMQNGGYGFRNLISLDYAPLSTMQGKAQPAYNGAWDGLNFVKLVGGEFLGKNRAFALTTDDEGNNELWEFGTPNRADQVRVCTDGTADVPIENPIECFVEYPLRNFGESKSRKRLERCDVWLTSVDGELDLGVDWRSDNSKKWLAWDDASTCAKTTDAATETPHVWKNLLPQERPQFKTFTIPDSVNEVVKYATEVGFEFQIRLRWTGRCRIHRVMVHGTVLDDPDFADRAGFEAACVEADITGNQITYEIPTGGCPLVLLYQNGIRVRGNRAFGLGAASSTPYPFTFCNDGPVDIVNFSVLLSTYCTLGFELTTPPPSTVPVGQCVEFVITYDPTQVDLCPEAQRNALVVLQVGANPILDFTVDDSAHPSLPSFADGPDNATVSEGGQAVFTSTVSGTNPIAKRWQVSGDGGTEWSNVEDDDNYSGADTDTLTITDTPIGFTGFLYRLRGTNEWGARYSDEAELTVNAASCTWSVLPNPPDSSGAAPVDADTYAQAFAIVDFISLLSSLVGPTFSTELVVGNASGPPGNVESFGQMLFAVNFGTSGLKSFSFDVSAQAGSFVSDPSAQNIVSLYSPDGSTLIDQDSDPSDGALSTTLSVTVPTAGQYLILINSARAGPSPTLQTKTVVGYTLGAGDAICTLE